VRFSFCGRKNLLNYGTIIRDSSFLFWFSGTAPLFPDARAGGSAERGTTIARSSHPDSHLEHAAGHGIDGDHGHDHHHGGHGHHEHPSPYARLAALLREERTDLIVLTCYTIIVGVLALAVPLAMQSLVNIIAARAATQPLIVLGFLVLVGLLAAGILNLLELSLVETMQQRIFARSALRMAQRMIRANSVALEATYGPELANRFFDVLTIQKSLAKLLLDGLAAFLSALVGLILMAVYSPILLGFDLFLLAFAAFVIFVLGIKGLRTSIAESAEKYKVASWLEELARCQVSFKMNGASNFLVRRADDLIVGYLRERRNHFRVTFRQAAGNQVFQAVANAGILILGGLLVINNEITLGQLVAAELIVVQVLKALDKLIQQAEVVYDLLTGLNKTGYLTDLETERAGGTPVPSSASGGISVVCKDVRFRYASGGDEVLMGLNLTVRPGERISLVGASGAGKSTLAGLLCGLMEPTHGLVEVGGVDVRDADLDSLRRQVALVGYSTEIFEGTIEENVMVGRPWVTHEDARWALDMAQMTDDIARMAKGTKTPLISGGKNLSRGQVQRVLIARAIADRPQLLILDEAFTGIDERLAIRILRTIFSPEQKWTIIDISHDPFVVMQTQTVHVLADGRIVETGSVEELARNEEGELSLLFPHLTEQIRTGGYNCNLAQAAVSAPDVPGPGDAPAPYRPSDRPIVRTTRNTPLRPAESE
jgi:ABC-type bacteriocin/lantibiotic exporter with double-glycine peptidase domain